MTIHDEQSAGTRGTSFLPHSLRRVWPQKHGSASKTLGGELSSESPFTPNNKKFKIMELNLTIITVTTMVSVNF